MPAVFSKTLLLTIAVGTLPIAGCDAVVIDQQLQAEYEQALATRTAASAADFIRENPDDYRVRGVLLNLPARELRRIPRSVVTLIPESTLARLPQSVLANLGIRPGTPYATPRRVGYTG